MQAGKHKLIGGQIRTEIYHSSSRESKELIDHTQPLVMGNLWTTKLIVFLIVQFFRKQWILIIAVKECHIYNGEGFNHEMIRFEL